MKFVTISTSKFSLASLHLVSPAVKDHTEVSRCVNSFCRWQQNANIADVDLEPSQLEPVS